MPSAKSFENRLGVGGLAEAGDHLDPDREVAVALAEGVPVLLRQHRRRDEHQRLLAVQRDREGRADGDLGLAEADVAADEPVHRRRRLQILLDRLDRALLVLRLPVRELGLEPLEPVAREVEGDARRGLAARVEGDQLPGQLLDGLARTALEQEPGLAAQLGERRGLGVRADVARDLADLLVRDVQPVLAAEAEEQIVARDAGDLLRLEAEQLADAVVLVDDVVADPEVGERLERPAEPRIAAGRPFAEDLRVGEQDEAEVAPDEAAPRRRHGEVQALLGRELVPLLQPADLEPAQEVGRPEGVTAVWERDHDPLAGPDERRELLLGLGETACRDRWPLRLEGRRLTARERIEQRRGVVRHGVERLLLPHTFDRLRLEDEVGRTVERRHQVGGDLERLALVSGSRGLGEIETPLRRRVDRRALDGPERTLREGRERANGLDLVAEQLDAERITSGRREDVDDPSANRELAPLLDPLDAFVAREREVLCERLDAGLVADGEVEPSGPDIRRRHRLRERDRRGAHEAAGGEDIECPRALPDEVRRGFQARLPADAAAREQRHAVVAQVPGRCLGRIARIGVLGEENEQRPIELQMEGGEDER